MKKIVITLIGLLFIVIELSVTNKFLIAGTRLNLLLIYALLLALNVDSKTDYICIAVVASIYDILISTVFGINLVWMVMVTFVSRVVMDKLYEGKIWSVAVIFILASATSVLYYFGINQILFVPQDVSRLLSIILQSMLINTVLGLVLNFTMKPIFDHIMKNWW